MAAAAKISIAPIAHRANTQEKRAEKLAQFLALFSGFSPVLAHSKSAFASQNELKQIKRKKPETVAVSGFP